MAQYGMIIDESKCVGCNACRVACQNQNSLRANESYNHLEERGGNKQMDFMGKVWNV